MEAYRIRDWDDLFENNRTRSMKAMRWVPIPNSFDGDRISELVARGGADAYAAWVALLLVASRCVPRGTLVRSSGEPYSPQALAGRTHLPAGCFEAMLTIAQDIGLIEFTGIRQEGAGKPHPTDEEGREGIEGREGKGRNKGGAKDSVQGKKNLDRLEAFLKALPDSHHGDALWSCLKEWIAYRASRGSALAPQTIALQAKKLGAMTPEEAISTLERSIENGWLGLFDNQKASGKSSTPQHRLDKAAREYPESLDLPMG